jgi:2',3'-cyclic-nucleotide 2'-phosphodiesterase (5'-nucleotidase family)
LTRTRLSPLSNAALRKVRSALKLVGCFGHPHQVGRERAHLVLDIGDFSIGTPFGGAIQQTGAELQCLFMIGYEATTFGNHEFDSGPAALANTVTAAHKAGRVPTILTANTNYDAADTGLV